MTNPKGKIVHQSRYITFSLVPAPWGEKMIAYHVGSVAAILISPDGKVLTVTQKRPDTVGGFTVEAPGGYKEDDEPLQNVIREIREETGFTQEDIEKIEPVCNVYLTPGFCNEKIWTYLFWLKTDVPSGQMDEGEIDNVSWYDPPELYNKILKNDINTDARTLAMLQYYLLKN